MSLINAALAPILLNVGGLPGLDSLEPRVKRQMLTFPGEVVVIDPDAVLLKLRLCQHGYRVFNSRMEFVHSVVYDINRAALYATQGPDVILPFITFGLDPRDALFVAQQPQGSVFYLAYNQVNSGRMTERLVMCLIAPDVPAVQATPMSELA